MKRRTGPCTYEEKAALILSDVRLEYLVSGRFGSGPDDRGFHSVAWVFHGDLLDHAGADTVKSAIQEYKNRLDKEFTALAKACDEADDE